MRLSLLIASLAAGPTLAQQFTPVGIPPHVYAGGWEHFVGGGLAAFDCDGDHLPELLAAGGSNPATLFRNRSERGLSVAFVADTPEQLAITGMTGAYPADIDSDGRVDLAILTVGENLLLKGGADCQFSPFEGLGFVGGSAWTTAFSATWEDGQTLPTLAFGNYVDRDHPDAPFQTCDTHDLFRPDGNRYGAPAVLGPGFCALSMLFSDWGRTGQADLRISNDRHYYVRGGQEQMWAMEPQPRLYGQADGWLAHELWGMGIASRDITGDGKPDVYLTSMGDQRFQMQEGNGAPTFRDAAFARGLTAHRPHVGDDGRPSTGWHAVFGDVQNDGLDDLFVTKGNVEQMPGSAFEDPNNLLVQDETGRFTERGTQAGVASMARGRGAAFADFDLDGRLDIAVVNRRAEMQVYRNTTPDTGNWLAITLLQDAPNRDAVGAWIEVDTGRRIHAREVTVGGGHAGGTLGPAHFGLGPSDTARVRVIWPDGETSHWTDIKSGSPVTLRRSGRNLLAARY